MVRTDILKRPDGDKFAKAVTGAWYEVMAQMTAGGAAGDKTLTAIASASQDSLASYKEQLSTTHLLSTATSAVQMATSADLKKTMDLVRKFCFSHGLLGEKTASADDVAIQFADGSTLGKSDRVRLRFNSAYMQAAAQGKL